MNDERPSPDVLLGAIQRDEARQRCGRLKVFLGMCAGVGKTFAMLEAARRELAAGRDVVIGYVETHGRKETDALAQGLPQLPRQQLDYRGVTMTELDLDAVLSRRPQLAIVDELAHTNVPGARHPKRWQDVAELLDAGIDVLTTLNVQHVESRANTVRQVTGAEIRETVPDSVLDSAVLELVDLPPAELVQRLCEGKVYLPDRAAAAAQNFFREGNLAALRELALRLVADHVGVDTREFRETQANAGPWKTAHCLLLGVGPSPFSEQLICWTRHMADGLRCRWLVVHVESSRALTSSAQAQLERNLATARELGAEVFTTTDDDLVRGLLRVGRQQNATQIIVGKPAGRGWLEWMRGDRLLRRLARDSGVGGAATPIANAALGRTLVKRGEGTVVLGNMQYLDATDSADASVQFTWQLGRAISGNYGSAQYFDGAVRGVAGGGKSNSLEGFCIQFCGGVYEVDVSAGSATFSRALGTGVTNVNWRGGQNSDVGGGGFAAYSTVPGNRLTVDLNNRGRDMLYFANGGSATYDYLPGVQDSAGSTAGANVFTFGSRTANAPVDFVDNIDLNTRILPIRVWDNTNSMLDRAILSGTLQNGGIQKQGDGVLELAGSNMYQNVTIVTNGTLLVNGYLNVGGAAVTVYSGATLGGTGIINRAVSVQDGGSIWPGDLGSGTLTVSNLTLSAASLSVITAGAGGAVAVQGNLVLGGTIMVANAASRPSGTYTIMTYGGTLSGTIAVGPLPGRMAATVDLAETGKVKLRLSSPGTLFSVN